MERRPPEGGKEVSRVGKKGWEFGVARRTFLQLVVRDTMEFYPIRREERLESARSIIPRLVYRVNRLET